MADQPKRPQKAVVRRARPAGPAADPRTAIVARGPAEPTAMGRPAGGGLMHFETPGDKLAVWSGLVLLLLPGTVLGQILGMVLAAKALRGPAGAIGWKRGLAWVSLVLNAVMLLLTLVTIALLPYFIYKIWDFVNHRVNELTGAMP